MLDVENVRKILQAEVNKREKAKAKWEKCRTSGNKPKEDLYERRYYKYCSRLDGMCDMLFELGYLAWCNKDNNIFVEKLVEGDNHLIVEIPF